jgi:hypothetical protein
MQISNLIVLSRIRLLQSGSEIYANFDLDLGDVRMLSCSLIRHRNGEVTVYGPPSGVRGKPTTFIMDPSRTEVATAVADLYAATTGVDLRAEGVPYAA